MLGCISQRSSSLQCNVMELWHHYYTVLHPTTITYHTADIREVL